MESPCEFRRKIVDVLLPRDVSEGFRILASRKFWRDFRDYWSGTAVSERIDDFTARLRENTGQEPDWDVERRRARRGAHRDD